MGSCVCARTMMGWWWDVIPHKKKQIKKFVIIIICLCFCFWWPLCLWALPLFKNNALLERNLLIMERFRPACGRLPYITALCMYPPKEYDASHTAIVHSVTCHFPSGVFVFSALHFYCCTSCVLPLKIKKKKTILVVRCFLEFSQFLPILPIFLSNIYLV